MGLLLLQTILYVNTVDTRDDDEWALNKFNFMDG